MQHYFIKRQSGSKRTKKFYDEMIYCLHRFVIVVHVVVFMPLTYVDVRIIVNREKKERKN